MFIQEFFNSLPQPPRDNPWPIDDKQKIHNTISLLMRLLATIPRV